MKAKKQALKQDGARAIARREGARRQVLKIVDGLADPGFFTVNPEDFYTVEDFGREVREYWEITEGLRGTIPGAAAAEDEARRRGRVFDDLAKRNIETLLMAFQKFYDFAPKATGDDEYQVESGGWSEDLVALRNELCARRLFVIERCCAALEALAKDAGDAGRLARAAICAFKNIPGTGDGRGEAIRAALAEADEAARAYFAGHFAGEDAGQLDAAEKKAETRHREVLDAIANVDNAARRGADAAEAARDAAERGADGIREWREYIKQLVAGYDGGTLANSPLTARKLKAVVKIWDDYSEQCKNERKRPSYNGCLDERGSDVVCDDYQLIQLVANAKELERAVHNFKEQERRR